MAADDFGRKGGSAGFSVAGGIKDVGHMQTLAAEKKVEPSIVYRHLIRLLRKPLLMPCWTLTPPAIGGILSQVRCFGALLSHKAARSSAVAGLLRTQPLLRRDLRRVAEGLAAAAGAHACGGRRAGASPGGAGGRARRRRLVGTGGGCAAAQRAA